MSKYAKIFVIFPTARTFDFIVLIIQTDFAVVSALRVASILFSHSFSYLLSGRSLRGA